MKLNEWLRDVGWTQERLAQEVNLTQGRISQIARDGTTDGVTARRISNITGGKVSIDELLPPEPEASASDAVAVCPHCGAETAGKTTCADGQCPLPIAARSVAAA